MLEKKGEKNKVKARILQRIWREQRERWSRHEAVGTA